MNVPSDPPFGQLLRQRRLAAGLSQAALAQRARLSVDAIAALERGRRTAPHAETLALLAKALGLTPAERAAFVAAGRAPVDAVPTRPSSPSSSPPPDALIGREEDIAAATRLVRERGARLLTLTGPGGVGKTRLAFAVAEHLRPIVDGRVALADLSALRDPALVPAAIARSLGLREVGARPVRELLLAELRDQPTLLVLDNCEQVLAAAPAVAELANACPRLIALATSRAPLRVRGEQQYPVGPLAVPAAGPLPPSALAANPAVALFLARARAASPGFALTADNAEAIAAICRRLDGLPLAIELAAARCALLPPAALLARLERRLAVLTQGARDLPDRQRTLRATLDWSYGLLAAPEQALFRRLAVFSGGGDPEMIEVVCAPEGAPAVLDGLAALVDHSLVRQVGTDEAPRFAMLETIREYAAEQLEQHGEADALRQAHAEQYVALAERAAAEIAGAEQEDWLARLEREHDNFRAALAWLLAGEETARRLLGLRLGAALWRFWQVRGHFSEGRSWLDRLLARNRALGAPEAAALRAATLAGAGRLAHSQSDFARAAALLEESLALYRALGHDVSLAEVLINRGLVAHARGDYAEAAMLLEESLGLYRARGDRAGTGNALFRLALITRERGDYARAKQLYEECLAVYRALGDRAGEATALLGLGDIARDQGEPALVAAYCQESLALYRALGERWGMACSLNNLGVAAYERGDLAEAAARCEESLALFRAIKVESSVAEELVNLGRIAAAQGEVGRAAALLAEGLRLARAGGPRWLVAAALEGLAALAPGGEAAELAARWLGAAEALREAMGSPLWPADRARYDRIVAAVEAALPAASFAAAWEAGRAAALDATIAAALGAAAAWAAPPSSAEGGEDGRSAPPIP